MIALHHAVPVSALPAAEIPIQVALSSIHGAVASESTTCSQIGIDLLKQGVSHMLGPSLRPDYGSEKTYRRAMRQTPTWGLSFALE